MGNRTTRGPSAWGGGGSGGGGSGAPTDAPYVTTAASGSLSAEVLIGAIILPPDVIANIPAAGTTVAGSLYFPTDETKVYRSTGAAWVVVADYTPGAGTGTVDTVVAGAGISVDATDPANPVVTAEVTQAELDAHLNDIADAHDASAISNVAAGNLVATDVQAAINELDTEKATTGSVTTVANDLASHLADAADAHDASAISILDAALDFTATDVEGALAELQADHEADATALSDHLADTAAAHAASAISADSTTLVGTGTDVQAVLEELDNGIADHLADTAAAHAATAIAFTPAGTIAATTVQAAIEEVASEAGGGAVSLAATMYRSTDQTGVADVTWTDVDFSTVLFDDATLADATNNEFTAPAIGRWRIEAGVEIAAASATTFLRVYKNGTTVVGYSGGWAESGAYDTVRLNVTTGWKVCAAGDTFKVQVFSDVASGTSTLKGDADGASTWATFEFIAD